MTSLGAKNMVRILLCATLSVSILLLANPGQSQSAKNKSSKEGSTMQLTSSAFQPGGNIPKQFTCEGNDTSPQLAWSGVPSGAKTLALIVHDPDAPRAGGFYHWVAYNISTTASGIPE